MRSLRFFVFLCALLPASLWAGPESVVTFNELMYHPAAAQTSGEWIELHNQHSVDVDLSGWRLDGGVDFVFPEGTRIRGAGYLVIAANPGAFQSATNRPAIGPFASVLSDDGETVTLKNKNGRVMDEIAYNDRFPWPIAADGSGATLAKINELGVSGDPRNWRASTAYGGTPMDYNFTPPVGGLVTAPSQAGIRRYFPFDGNAQDASGLNFHGTLQGGVGFSSETPPLLGVGQSLDCDGVNDYVQIMDSQQPTAYTIAVWVKPDTIRKQSIIVRGGAGGTSFAMANQLRMDAAGHFEHSTASVIVTGTTIAQAGQWYHVCITAGNGGMLRLYVNGLQEGPTKPVTSLPTGNDRWLIGSNSFSSFTYFDGRIDDVAIWHTAFDPPTVAAVAAGTMRPTDPAPVNVAFLKPVINASGHFPNLTFDQPPNGGNDFRAQHVTDGSDTDVYSVTYWLGREATPNEWFIVDLGAPQAIKQLLLRNTHNSIYNDRGTLNFRVFAASGVDASNQLVSPVQILAGTLSQTASQTPIVAGAYTTQNGLTATTARYLKFESLTAVNNNAGLNEFEVYTAFKGDPGLTTPRPQDVPLVFNEITAAGAAPFWVELQNYGGALPIDGYVIASETGAQFTIPAQTLASGGFVTFDAAQLGFTPLADEKLFLYAPAKAAVLDAVKLKPRHQARRVASPPGEFLETTNPAEQTPGAVNNVALSTAIVINEIMYQHRPQYHDGAVPLVVNKEQWVELYNKSAAAVDVGGWKLDDAIGYTFPPGTSIPAGGFIVVADDLVNFNAAHPGVTALGPISGSLSNLGERLVLLDSLGNVIDEVNYRGGKPWPEFAAGGGSSLELRNPDADNSVPEAWAASDETGRSSWQNYTFTATAHTPVYTPNIYNFHELRLGLLDAGEVLIDDVSVIEDPGGPLNRELMQNGSFSTGTGAWRLLGNHETSGAVSDGGGNVLKIVASGASNYHPNLLETSLKAAGALVPVVENRNYKISFRAKWLRGSPQLHCELYYNKVAKTVILAQPALSGTPGAQNSTFVANLGPTYKDVRHSPVIPGALQAITVSGLLSDPQGVNSAALKYVVNGGSIGSAAMALGTDGRWAGTIPGQAANAVVQFWIEGRDGSNALATWPAAAQGSRALIQVADNRASASKQNIRVTMASADAAALYNANDMMSNRHRGCTIVVNESEIFYDSEVRLHGSMFTRNAPANGALNLYFPADHPYRGLNEKVRVRISGRNEIVVKHLISAAGGLPENFNDSAWLVGPNNVGNTAVRVETTEFDDNYFDDDAADGTQGTSFKMEGIREYQTTVDGNPESRKSPWPQIGWVYAFDIADDGGTNPELYRHDFKFTSNRAQDNNSKIVAMCQAFSKPVGPAMDAAVDAAINADEWMRCFALESLCGIGDAYGFINGNPHNLNFYAPPAAGKVLAVPWDWNFAFYNPTDTPMLPSSHNISVVAARPIFARLFWGHVRDLCQTVFNSSYISSWLAHYSLHMGDDYSSYGSYIDARRASALAQLPAAVPFAITTNGGNPIFVNGATTTLQGHGWIDVREIHINGSPEGLLVTWIDGTTWMVTIPVATGTNNVTLTAYDHHGVLVGTATIVVTGTGGTVPASPANLVISEVMYNPATNPDDEFIEVQNIGAQTIDLTGCSFTGIDYNFANSATLAPGGRMTIPKAQFLNGTGLSNSGERIVLSAPGGVVIKDFTYADSEPWPTSADGIGRSIVLISPQTNPDPKNPFNWRPSTADGGNPGASDALPAPADPLGDSNGNGWPNLLEYAVKMPVTTQGFDVTGHLTLAFTRNLAADGAMYFVETSPDMQTWTGGTAVERVNQAMPVGATMIETWRTVALPVPGGKQFMRLRVQLRP